MAVPLQNTLLLTPEAKGQFDRLVPLLEGPLADLPERDRDLFVIRLARQFQNLYDGLKPLYGEREDFDEVLARLALLLAERYRARPEALKTLDLERDLTPDWFQRETVVGYVFYAQRFAGTLKGILEHADYLGELGATYLHLMAVIRAREGENDGGYAVADYLEVNPELGTVDDLEEVCAALRGRGVSVCVDLVLNHCADEHDWARRARAGDERYRDYFYSYPDRALPDAFERTLPEVFPDFAPGNFSWVPEMNRWLWTTFNSYQWDLNWSNPEVFLEVTGTLLELANRGVEVFRLDAVAFLWKRLGSDCQNQPEVHSLLQALRACSRVAAPAVAHKAEAIVSPQDLIHYFGTGKHYGKVSNIAYHNTLMVQYWSALASRDTRLMTHVLREFPRTPSQVAWGTYIRGHDDIGWAVTDEDAAAVGLGGFAHRSFLSDFYAGLFPGSFARGEVFQFNPLTGDRRISGTFASLAGLELALESGDEDAVTLAIERILLGFALMASFGGIPLLCMGDEIGLLNDPRYAEQPELAGDNRWLHRPFMDWKKADRRRREGTVEARIFSGVRRIVLARKATPHFHAHYASLVLDTGHPHLFAFVRPHPLGNLLALFNFSERPQSLPAGLLDEWRLPSPVDALSGRAVESAGGAISLESYQRLWLV
jgi:amylosucrase